MKTAKVKEVKEEAVERQVEPEIIADVKRSDSEVIRVSKKQFKGVSYLDLRVYFKPEGAEGYLPSKKGITVRKEQIHELAKAVCQADEGFRA
jgi:hypothetical protein